MSRIMVFDSEYATLWLHPEKKIVEHKFKKFLYGKELRDLLLKGTELMEEKKANKWLSDDRNNNAITPEDDAWGKAEWFPRTMKAGWKYWAIVLPRRVVGQMNMKERIAIYAQAGLTAQVFDNPAKALAWLESLPD